MAESECRDKGCRKTVDSINEYVFGRLPGTDIRNCMQKLVPKHWIWKFMVSFGAPIVVCGFFLVGSVKSGEKDHAQNVKDIVAMQKDIKEIKKDVNTQSGELIEIKVLQRTVLEKISEIREAQKP